MHKIPANFGEKKILQKTVFPTIVTKIHTIFSPLANVKNMAAPANAMAAVELKTEDQL